MTDYMNEQRLNEGGPDAIRPGDTIQARTNEQLAEELFQCLEEIGVTPPSEFNAARNEHVRALMSSLSPYRADGHPLNANRCRLNRILVLLLELRARELRS